jgi:branched-chain amino acid transport system permease protein
VTRASAGARPHPRRLPLPWPRLLSAASALLLAALGFWLAANLLTAPGAFLDMTLIGITLGCMYALIALGYTLVWGLLELINFAHGDVFMLGGMFTITLASRFHVRQGQGLWLLGKLSAVLLLAMLICAGVNATIELVAYRRLRNAPRLAPLITAIGASFIIEDVTLAWMGPNYAVAPDVLPDGTIFTVSGFAYSWNKLIVVGVTLLVLLGLVYLVVRTRQGKAMRAVAQDMHAAAMLGVNINRTISFTFLIAGALAAVAGFLYALYETNIRFDQGFQLGLIAFTAAVLGGVGNLPGAVLGGVAIGLIQSYNEGLPWHAPGSDWTESIVFTILILILIFRPQGFLGEAAHN